LVLSELLLSEIGPFATDRLKAVARFIADFRPVSGSLGPD
jgi:hypothetical protein